MDPQAARSAGGTRPGDGIEPFAAALRGFGPIGLAAIAVVLSGNLLFPPLSALLVLLWVRLSHLPWSAIGYVRPRSWPRTTIAGVGLGIGLKLLMKAVVMPLLGAPPLNAPYQFLVGDTRAALGMLVLVVVVAGWGEETLFRGYLFERLGALLGRRPWARALTVVVVSVFFGLLHLKDQGVPGAEQAFVTGMVFGTIYAATGSLWMPIVAHAAFDVAAVIIIWAGLERSVAHWVFR